MATPQASDRKRHRDYGDGGISWDKVNNCFVGRISLGFDSDGKRLRRSVRGRTKTEVKDKLEELRAEIKAGIRPTPSGSALRTGWTRSRSIRLPSPSTGGKPRNGFIRNSARGS